MSKYAKEVNKYLIRVQQGDKTQLGAVFELTANHLRAVAIKYLINKSYCDDVVSDAFCKALQYISSFDKKKDGYNWMCKIVEKVAYTYNEQEKVRRENTLAIEAIETVGLEEDNKETNIDLRTAIEKLPPQSQEIVYDYYCKSLTYAEMANKYHITKSAVHKRIKSIHKEMKKFLLEGEQID